MASKKKVIAEVENCGTDEHQMTIEEAKQYGITIRREDINHIDSIED